MTSWSHKIPKYDWRWTGGGWRAGWLGLVITDESLRTSVIWIYTVVWAYKRTKYTIPTARGAHLDWPWRPCPSLTCPGKKNINPTWHVTLCSHIFADVLYDCHESYFFVTWQATWNVTASFLTACSHVFVDISRFFFRMTFIYDLL